MIAGCFAFSYPLLDRFPGHVPGGGVAHPDVAADCLLAIKPSLIKPAADTLQEFELEKL